MAIRKIAHPSVDDRKAKGLAARDRAAPSSHTKWRPAADRPDPVVLLEEQDTTREPDLVPVRHGRMMVSPFTFYRGAAKIMAADLADTPVAGLDAQLCGDAHLSNFGLFASPERRLLFDLNDFDETLPGPFEFDVKRMAASFTIAARLHGDHGTRRHQRVPPIATSQQAPVSPRRWGLPPHDATRAHATARTRWLAMRVIKPGQRRPLRRPAQPTRRRSRALQLRIRAVPVQRA